MFSSGGDKYAIGEQRAAQYSAQSTTLFVLCACLRRMALQEASASNTHALGGHDHDDSEDHLPYRRHGS